MNKARIARSRVWAYKGLDCMLKGAEVHEAWVACFLVCVVTVHAHGTQPRRFGGATRACGCSQPPRHVAVRVAPPAAAVVHVHHPTRCARAARPGLARVAVAEVLTATVAMNLHGRARTGTGNAISWWTPVCASPLHASSLPTATR